MSDGQMDGRSNMGPSGGWVENVMDGRTDGCIV